MAIKVYNTLKRKKENLKPLKENNLNIFVCGPTVYSFVHLGNARTFTNYDFIVKYLRYSGFKVSYIQNITDIDDRIIEQAKKEKLTWKNISGKYEKIFLDDMKMLGNNAVSKYAKATDYIENIKSQVSRLMEKGYAYVVEDDGIYFDLKKDKDYGKLSRRTSLQADDAVTRIDDSVNKRNKGDFCLWKFADGFWKFEINGEDYSGRPGWHIEDTAITEEEFGSQYDMHGGAIDLIFPHHEAEIAQMESLTGKKPFVRYWLHSGFLNFNKEKMSKSIGNVFNLHEALKKYDPKVIRYLFISSHYRMPLDFNENSLEQASNSLKRINEFFYKSKSSKENIDKKLIEKTRKDFEKAMDDDFDTPKALAVLFNFIREANKLGNGRNSYEFLKEIDTIFNILPEEKKLSLELERLIKEREEARKSRDFKKSDKLRESLKKKGVEVKDEKDGSTSWSFN